MSSIRFELRNFYNLLYWEARKFWKDVCPYSMGLWNLERCIQDRLQNPISDQLKEDI